MAAQIQPDKGWAVDAAGTKTRRFSVMGTQEEVDTYTQTHGKGDFIDGYGVVSAIDMVGGPGGSATARYTCLPKTTTGGGEDDPEETEPLSDIWSLGNTRIELPITAYCGPNLSTDASLRHIQLWRNEQDVTLWQAFKYRDILGAVIDLNALGSPKTKQMAEMIMGGQEVVVRYFPLITRRRTYPESPRFPLTVGFIDVPGQHVAGFQGAWLKITEDISQEPSGSWMTLEQWQGADSYRPEFYGPVVGRWKVGGSSAG